MQNRDNLRGPRPMIREYPFGQRVVMIKPSPRETTPRIPREDIRWDTLNPIVDKYGDYDIDYRKGQKWNRLDHTTLPKINVTNKL